MNEPFSDELISAFLDGEVTPDEQSAVEQALVEDAECRQLFEELRALRGSLQSLPGCQLPGDFAQRVIRRAERAMLREAQPDLTPLNTKPEDETSDLRQTNQPSPANSQPSTVALPAQGQAWHVFGVTVAAAALAAALLVALYLPDFKINSVVHNGGENGRRAALPAAPHPDSSRVSSSTSAGGPEAPAPRSETVPTRSLQPLEEKARPIQPANKGKEGLGFSDRLGARYADGEAEGLDAAKPESAPSRQGVTRQPAPESQAPRAQKDVVPSLVEAESAAASSDSKSRNAGFKKMPLGNAGAGALSGAPLAAPGGASAEQQTGAQSREMFALGGRETDAQTLNWVIRVTETRKALEEGAFDSLLGKRNIRFEDAAQGSVKDAAESKQLRQLSDQVSAEGVDVVIVEATVDQIQAVLADMQVQQDRFLGVASQQLAADGANRSFQFEPAVRAKLQTSRQIQGNLEAVPAEKPGNRDKGADGAPLAGFGAASPGPGGLGGGAAAPAPAATAGVAAAASGGSKPAPAPGGAKAADRRLVDADKPIVDAEKQPLETSKALEEQGDPLGRASRIAPAYFKRYTPIDARKLRSAGDDVQSFRRFRAPDDADQVRLENGNAGEASSGKNATYPLKRTEDKLQLLKEGKPLADPKPSAKNGALQGPLDEGLVAGEKGQQLRKANLPVARPDRVRVLFVIRALEQDAAEAGKPDASQPAK